MGNNGAVMVKESLWWLHLNCSSGKVSVTQMYVMQTIPNSTYFGLPHEGQFKQAEWKCLPFTKLLPALTLDLKSDASSRIIQHGHHS